MTELSVQQFIDLVRSQPTIKDIRVNGEIIVNDNIAPSQSRNFDNCEFTSIKFPSLESFKISFQGCTISNKLEIQFTSRSSFTFTEGTSELIKLGTTDTSQVKVSIEGSKTKITKLELINSYVQIEIKDSTIKELSYDAKRNSSNKCKSLKVNAANIDKANFNGAIDSVEIMNSKINNYHFQNTINDTITIFNSSETNFRFDGLDCRANFTVMQCNNSNFHFLGCQAKHLVFNPGKYQNVTFESNGHYNFRTVRGNEKDVTEFTEIDTLQFISFQSNEKCNFDFVKTKFKKLKLDYLENYGTIQFSNCEITENLHIKESNLRKSVFNNITIKDSCDIDFIDSNITDTIFTNFRWINNYMLCEDYTISKYDSKINYLISLRESYRQLKSNYSKNGNKIESLEFQKQELRVHFEILKLHKTSSLRNFGNFLIVGSNKLFSDFGQNIWKPLAFLFSFHFIFYNLFIQFNDLGYNWSWSWSFYNQNDMNTTCKAISNYFVTLMPTHAFIIDEINVAGFWDFLLRVSSGYFIFYFISASRKYHQ